MTLLTGSCRRLTRAAIEKLFAKVSIATELLVPMDSSTFDLKDITPQYSAMFQFKLGKSEFLNLRKEISPMKSEHTENEISDTQWTRDTRINLSPLQLFKVPLQKYVDNNIWGRVLIGDKGNGMENPNLCEQQSR